MGQVYRATDTKLESVRSRSRSCRDAFAADTDRLARFQREAKTLASLNHPNIAAHLRPGRSGGVHALVMELVEGEDLSQRIARGPIPLDEALPIAKQIAEALEAAHEQGIIHRDLKPANIKVRADGTVKVLDFGLAKAMEPRRCVAERPRETSPTLTSPAMTQAGMILGTAAYMSPEQARGKPVDKRADIWAFGCVLYRDADRHARVRGRGVSTRWRRCCAPSRIGRRCRRPARRRSGDCCRAASRKIASGGSPHAADARLEIDEALAAPARPATVAP